MCGASKKPCIRDPSPNNNQTIHSISSCNIVETMTAIEVMESPEKPESDKKSYRVIRLGNGLKALLVSDPTPLEIQAVALIEKDGSGKIRDENESSQIDATSEEESEEDEEDEEQDDDDQEAGEQKEKQAACSLCVGVGSFSDPRDIQGLAHFLG